MRLRLVVLLLAALAVLFACGGETSEPVNAAPTADAGSGVTIKIGGTVNLDGSASTDPEGQPLTYSWQITSRPSGSACVFTNGNTNATASFIPDRTGTYTVSLTVNDGNSSSEPATVTVTVNEQDPDLVAVEASAVGTTFFQGDALPLTAVVSNGHLGASGTFRTGFYLSADAAITTGDIFLGYTTSDSLDQNQVASILTNLTIPVSTTPGTYYLGAIADYEGLVAETNEANNSVASVSAIQVIAHTIDLAPSSVTRASNTIFQGESMQVSCKVTNSGNTVSGSFRLGIYLSTDSSITTGDTLAGYVTVSSVGTAAAAVTVTTDITIPGGLAAGTYYVGVIADDQNAITEVSEADNAAYAASTVTVLAHTKNIVLNSATIPASATSGSTISIPYNIQNSGNTATGTFRLGVYLSEDATVTTGDTLIGSDTLSLAASGSTSGTLSATIPYLTSRKTYYIGVIADDQSVVTETNESDNSSSGSSSVTAQKVDWVMMVYIAGDNSLSSDAAGDLNEMKAASLSGQKVRVITLIDQAGSSDTYLYEVFSGKTVQLASTELGLNATGAGELDTGNPATLGNFINYVTNNYPATNYQLVIWNHGDGWKSSTKKISPRIKLTATGTKGLTFSPVSKKVIKPLTKGICEDASSGSYIYNNQVQTVLSGSGIRLLSMDACLMGMVETAYEMRKSVTGIDYITFSQNTEPGTGYPYTSILNHYLGASDTSASNFARIVVEDYVAYYGSSSDVTQSAVDLSKIGDVVTALDTFVTFLGTQTQSVLDTARANTESYADAYNVDLWTFVNKFADSSATALKTAIESAVIAKGSGSLKPNARGLAIYFTTMNPDPDYIDSNNTYSIDFLNDSTWDNFVASKTFGLTIDTAEPANDNPGGMVISSGFQTGYIADYGDQDIYTINVSAGGTLTVNLSSVPADCDIDIYLYDSSFTLVNGSESGLYGAGEYFSHTATAQTYYLLVNPYDGFNLSSSYLLYLSGTATY